MITLEITLRSIKLEAPLKSTGSVVLVPQLVLPRPSILSKSTIKTLQLRNGGRSLLRAPFYESGLFKERVGGRFGLQLRLTAPQSNPEVQQLIQSMLALGTEAVGGVLAAGYPLAAVRPLIRGPFRELASRIDNSDLDFIAVAGVDLDSEQAMPETLRLPLKLNRTIRRTQLPPGPKQREGRKPGARTYRKDSVVGEVLLGLRVG